jgi:anti-sigma regulatory factor (Ser/Thr protein kinase)
VAGTEPGSATATRARLALELAAEPDNVGVARRALRDLLVAAGVDKERVSDIALAVSEACANAVLHAYAAHGGTFEVRAALASGSLAVAVSDHGSGMAPRSDSPGLGVGLPVMAAIADVLEIDTPADSGTVVRMTFELPARPR